MQCTLQTVTQKLSNVDETLGTFLSGIHLMTTSIHVLKQRPIGQFVLHQLICTSISFSQCLTNVSHCTHIPFQLFYGCGN